MAFGNGLQHDAHNSVFRVTKPADADESYETEQLDIVSETELPISRKAKRASTYHASSDVNRSDRVAHDVRVIQTASAMTKQRSTRSSKYGSSPDIARMDREASLGLRQVQSAQVLSAASERSTMRSTSSTNSLQSLRSDTRYARGGIARTGSKAISPCTPMSDETPTRFYYYTNAATIEEIRKSGRLSGAKSGTSKGGMYFTTLEPTKYLKEYIVHNGGRRASRSDADFVVEVEIPRDRVRVGDMPGCYAILLGLLGGTMHKIQQRSKTGSDVWMWNASSLNIKSFPTKIFRIQDQVEFEDVPAAKETGERSWFQLSFLEKEAKPMRKVVSSAKLIPVSA